MIKLFLLAALLVGNVSCAGGGSSSRGKWSVIDPNSGMPCITLWAQLDLDLSYIVKGTEATNRSDKEPYCVTGLHSASQKDGHLTVPSSSTVRKTNLGESGSSCLQTVTFKDINGNNVGIISQILWLDMDHMPGWSIKFSFTKDPRFDTNDKQWALYKVDVYANYSSYPGQFPNAAEAGHNYLSPVNFNDDNNFADNIYASLGDSMYCPSKHKYWITKDETQGPKSMITFSILQLQAYMDTEYVGMVPFGNKITCPTDQHTTDKVPIIVGGCLAGLIVLTMVIYLIYRACLPKEVIQLVNPESHFENRAMTVDDEKDDNSETQHGH